MLVEETGLVGAVRFCILVTLDTEHLAVSQCVAAAGALGLLVVVLDAALRATTRVTASAAPTLALAAGTLYRGVLDGLGKSHDDTSSPTSMAVTPEGYRRGVTQVECNQTVMNAPAYR